MPLPRVGSLEALPVLAHPELLAPPVHAALESWPGATEVAVVEIDPEYADTAAMSQRYGVPMAFGANCVVVMGRRMKSEEMPTLPEGFFTSPAFVSLAALMSFDACASVPCCRFSFQSFAINVSLTLCGRGGEVVAGLFGLAPHFTLPAAEPLLQPFKVEVDDRRQVQRQHLRDGQAADDGQPVIFRPARDGWSAAGRCCAGAR